MTDLYFTELSEPPGIESGIDLFFENYHPACSNDRKNYETELFRWHLFHVFANAHPSFNKCAHIDAY